MSAQQSKKSRYLKYGIFTLIGLAIGAAIARSKKEAKPRASPRPTRARPDPTPPTRAARQESGARPGVVAPRQAPPAAVANGQGGANRTGAERDYSDPSSGPLIGEQHSDVEGVGEQQDEFEQRIRTQIGEDPRTAEMPRVNVEVNDGIAELRGAAPSEDAKLAAGEIAQAVEGVREVRNLIQLASSIRLRLQPCRLMPEAEAPPLSTAGAFSLSLISVSMFPDA